MTAVLERSEREEGYEIQLVPTHFERIGYDEAEMIESNSKESCNSLDENEREMWQ